MHTARTVDLPPSPYAAQRTFTHGYAGNEDLLFEFKTRAPYLEGERSASRISFGFKHGSDLSILATCIGYYRYMAMSENRIKDVFVTAAKSVLDEAAEDTGSGRYDSGELWEAEHTASGSGYPGYEHPVYGWKALCYPILPQPGNREEKGATGFYARENVLGHCTLTLVKMAPEWAGVLGSSRVTTPETLDLFPDDIPVIAQVICEQSMGIYRENLHDLIQQEFFNEQGLDSGCNN